MNIAVCWPSDPENRAALRTLLNQELPIIVPGSVEKPCQGCGVSLAVGPRVQSTDAPVMCIFCMLSTLGEEPPSVVSLDNPDSRLETPADIQAEGLPPKVNP